MELNKYRLRGLLEKEYVEVDKELRNELSSFYEKHGSDEELYKFIEMILGRVASAQYKLGAERQKVVIERDFELKPKYPKGDKKDVLYMPVNKVIEMEEVDFTKHISVELEREGFAGDVELEVEKRKVLLQKAVLNLKDDARNSEIYKGSSTDFMNGLLK